MELSIPVFVFLLILFATTIAWFLLKSPKKTLPPGPFNLPLLGALPLLGKLPHVTLHTLSKIYGDIMYMKLGTTPLFVVSSGRAAKEIYKHHGLELVASKPRLIFGKYISHNFSGIGFKEYGPEVKSSRKIINTHLLSAARLKDFEKDRHEEHLGLVRSIISEEGRPFKLIQKLHAMNINMASRMLLGKRLYGENSRENEALRETVLEIVKLAGMFNLSDVIPALKWMDLQGLEKQYKKLCSELDHHLVSVMQERKLNPSTGSFIDTLISLDSTEEQVSDDTKLGLLCELLAAAVDTSAVTIEWAMTELFRHPHLLQKARKEIEDVVGDKRVVNESDLENLPFIQAIAKETLRLYPPAPLALPKIALGGSKKFGEYTVPENAWVYINFYAVGRDEDYWKNPLQFSPERFLVSKVDVFGQDFNLLPFGSGRRVCPGARLGFDTVQIGVATLVQGFEWEFSDKQDMGVTYGLVCSKTEPLVAAAKPRISVL